MCQTCGTKFTKDNCQIRVVKRGKNKGLKLKSCRLCTADKRDRRKLRESDWFKEQMINLDGRCAICNERPAVAIDHDHVTGMVRGVLCTDCNTNLGKLRDRSDIMRWMADYVDYYREAHSRGEAPEYPRETAAE